jgi:hypothetical protein
MIIFYSGLSGAGVFPENLLAERAPGVMLTFNDIHGKTKGATARRRFEEFQKHQPKGSRYHEKLKTRSTSKR